MFSDVFGRVDKKETSSFYKGVRTESRAQEDCKTIVFNLQNTNADALS